MKTNFTEEELIQIKDLFEKGFGKRKIAKIMKVNKYVISCAYEQLGLDNSKRQSLRFAFAMTEKSCATCKQIKRVELFRKRIGKYADGTERISYESSCLECDKLYNNERGKKRAKRLRATNPLFSIKTSISHAIWHTITNNGGNKNGESCIPYLPYTISEFKKWIENLFEPWMNWDNYGRYNKGDLFNIKWNIDHIIPQSDLPYDSMEHPNFQKCWALSNLRPLCARQNVLDGVKGLRHKKSN